MNHLFISIQRQRLFLVQNGRCEKSYPVSTAKNGVGELAGSYCTPRGWHSVADIIGLDAPINAVFKARKVTGQIYTPELEKEFPKEDWILTRIIRLKGREISFNQGGNCDTYNRFVYIHACPDHYVLGQAESHGCIRMHNQAVVELASYVKAGDSLFIA